MRELLKLSLKESAKMSLYFVLGALLASPVMVWVEHKRDAQKAKFFAENRLIEKCVRARGGK